MINDLLLKPLFPDLSLNIVTGQNKDDDIVRLKTGLQNNTLSAAVVKKHLLSEDMLYFITQVDSEPILRMYIPSHLQQDVVSHFHETLSHLGIDNTYEATRAKYYRVNLYKDVTSYVNQCVTCQLRSSKTTRPIVQESDMRYRCFWSISNLS